MPERHSDFRPPRHAYLHDLLLRCVRGRPSFVASLTVVSSLLDSQVVRLRMLRISWARGAALPTAYACFDVLGPGRFPCSLSFLRGLCRLGFSVGYCRTQILVSAAVLAWVTQDFCFCRLRMSRWLSTWRVLGFVPGGTRRGVAVQSPWFEIKLLAWCWSASRLFAVGATLAGLSCFLQRGTAHSSTRQRGCVSE